jgi:hypothetical protein
VNRENTIMTARSECVRCAPAGPGVLFAETLPRYPPVPVPVLVLGFRLRKQGTDFDCVAAAVVAAAAAAAAEAGKNHCLYLLLRCWKHLGWDRSVAPQGQRSAIR